MEAFEGEIMTHPLQSLRACSSQFRDFSIKLATFSSSLTFLGRHFDVCYTRIAFLSSRLSKGVRFAPSGSQFGISGKQAEMAAMSMSAMVSARPARVVMPARAQPARRSLVVRAAAITQKVAYLDAASLKLSYDSVSQFATARFG